jgi:uracil-DNA glycosylase family 4
MIEVAQMKLNYMPSKDSVKKLNADIVGCRRCPRLVKYREMVAVEKRKSFRDEDYWGKPVPNFGDAKARFLILGLAPAAHGANRTSRMFTGDRSGQWLYRALHRSGFANQATYEFANDGLKLNNCVISAVAHCAPPDNKPLPTEIVNCSEYLLRSLSIHQPRVILCLGSIAWQATFSYLKSQELWNEARPKFAHGVVIKLKGDRSIVGSYHPSQQNTFTGRLTEKMFDDVFVKIKKLL